MNLSLARLALPVFLLAAPAPHQDDFQPLVKGDDPNQFQLVGLPPESLAVKDGEIRVPSKPNGYFATKESYKNYVLKFDWLYERPENLASDDKFDGNSGLLLHITGEPKVWPKCVEIQLQYGDAGSIFAINGSKFSGTKDAEAQKKARRPVGQWNEEEVVCKDGEITCKINGIEVARGGGATPAAGQIGWQAEGAPIRLRNVKIKPLN